MKYQPPSQKTILEIQKIDWTKNWSGKFCLLLSSFSIDTFTRGCKKFFGSGLNLALYFNENGIITCWLSAAQIQKFGKKLSQKIINDPLIIKKWQVILKNTTDKILEIIKNPPSYFLKADNFLKFYKTYSIFEPHFIAIKLVAYYLPSQSLKLHHQELEKARKYTEPIHDFLEKLFTRLAILISQKENYSPSEILTLDYLEFIDFLKNKKFPKNFQKRHPTSLLYVNGKNKYIFTKEAQETLKFIFREKFNSVLMGTTAYPEKAKGVAKIISDPSIIATEITTGVIKDGDLPEINTSKDKIKILKKSSQ
jgi:hypothetical protein